MSSCPSKDLNFEDEFFLKKKEYKSLDKYRNDGIKILTSNENLR